MPETSHRDFASLLNILDSIRRIFDYSKPFSTADDLYSDTKSFDAVMMNFVVIGEMAEKLSSEFKLKTENQIDWFQIRGFRNIIAHNYFGIDAEEVWQIIKGSLVDLEKNIQLILDK